MKTYRTLKYLYLLVIFFALLSTTSCDDLVIANITEDNVELLTPKNNEELNINPILFSWDRLSGAEQYRFQIIGNEFGISSEYLLDSLLNKTWIELHLQPGQYEWRVKGVNSEYESLYTSRIVNILSK